MLVARTSDKIPVVRRGWGIVSRQRPYYRCRFRTTIHVSQKVLHVTFLSTGFMRPPMAYSCTRLSLGQGEAGTKVAGVEFAERGRRQVVLSSHHAIRHLFRRLAETRPHRGSRRTSLPPYLGGCRCISRRAARVSRGAGSADHAVRVYRSLSSAGGWDSHALCPSRKIALWTEACAPVYEE